MQPLHFGLNQLANFQVPGGKFAVCTGGMDKPGLGLGINQANAHSSGCIGIMPQTAQIDPGALPVALHQLSGIILANPGHQQGRDPLGSQADRNIRSAPAGRNDHLLKCNRTRSAELHRPFCRSHPGWRSQIPLLSSGLLFLPSVYLTHRSVGL